MAFPPFTMMISFASASALAVGCCACADDNAARTRARSPAHADRPTTLATMATPLLGQLIVSVVHCLVVDCLVVDCLGSLSHGRSTTRTPEGPAITAVCARPTNSPC